jgi:hypothetical protein
MSGEVVEGVVIDPARLVAAVAQAQDQVINPEAVEALREQAEADIGEQYDAEMTSYLAAAAGAAFFVDDEDAGSHSGIVGRPAEQEQSG